MPDGPACALKTALIVAAVAVGLALSVSSHAAKQAEPAAHADASQLGKVVPVAATVQKQASAGTDSSKGGDSNDGSDGNTAAAEVVVPAGPPTRLPGGNATLSQLLRLWGVFGDKVDSGCASLSVGDLRCLAGQGNLAMLARLNRPALLLLGRDGHQQWVLLSTLDDNQAALVGADGARRMDRQQLARLWSGRFEMVWRAADGKALIRRGMRGPAVAWLQQQLVVAADTNKQADRKADDRTDSKSGQDTGAGHSAAARFDADMEALVRNFQLLHGLQPDGLVGPRTQLVLNGLTLDPGVPTLTPESEDEE